MYFQKFPITYYTLDDRKSVQVVTNITLRNVFTEELKNNFVLFDEYDIKEGETPEIVADKFYNSSTYHWVILHLNEILDPRYDWPLSSNDFNKHIQQKYNDVNAVHHYEDASGSIVNGNVTIYSSAEFNNLSVGNVIINSTNTGTGFITSKLNSSTLIVTTTDGGFITGDQIKLSSNSNVIANITSTASITGTAVTNYVYEDTLNETKRRIKILKPQFLDSLVEEFTLKLSF